MATTGNEVGGIVAPVVDGKLKYDYSKKPESETLAKGSNLGYDEFLQLLCAEMQYQDPLEPTSNTEYVAQLATFSQLEATLSLEASQRSSMANDLVGKHVIMKIEADDGKTTYVDGRVDYTLYQDGKIYLSVNDSLYPIEQLDTVADEQYYEATGLAKSIENMIEQLPDVENLTAEHELLVKQIAEVYDGMSSYQQKFVKAETLTKLMEYVQRMQELLAAKEAAEKEAAELAASQGTQGEQEAAGENTAEPTENTGTSGVA